MPRYILDDYTPELLSDLHSNKKIKKEYKNYTNCTDSNRDFKDISNPKRELISSYVKTQKQHKVRSDAGDMAVELAREGKRVPWIEEGFDHLKSMEITSFSQGQGDDHFLQVLNTKAPNAQATSDLLDQVMELRAELEGRIRELSDFKEDIRELGKLLKANPSRQPSTTQPQPSP